MYALVIVFAMIFSASAQEITPREAQVKGSNSVLVPNQQSSRVLNDTLGWDDFLTYTTQIWSWGWTSGGYIFGTGAQDEGYAFNTFAQGYLNDQTSNFGVVGAWLWVSAIDVKSPSPCDIELSVQLLTGNSSYSGGGVSYDITCPSGTALAVGSFNITDVDTVSGASGGANGLLGVDFNSTVLITPGVDFAIVFDASACTISGDTIGVIASDDGVANNIYGEEYTFLKYAAASPFWILVTHAIQGGTGRMPALFAIVDLDFVNVDEVDFFQGMQLTLSPNPTADILTLAYGVKNNTNARVEIIDMNGRIVYSSDYGYVTAGSYSTTVDVSNFAAGQYYACVVSDNGRLTKKLIIQ